MTPLPFVLPVLSRGFAALTPAAREAGRATAEAASRALSDLLGVEVHVAGEPSPAPATSGPGMARVAIALEGLPGVAGLDVDARLLARTVERLAGGAERTPAARAATSVEQGVLELLVLAVLDAVRAPRVDALVPRLAEAGDAPADALSVALDITVAEERGRGRLRVPALAVAALGGGPELATAMAAVAVDGSFRDGSISLTPDDLAAITPGDVLVLDDDEGTAPGPEIVLPGGLALRGQARGFEFHVVEIHMTETQATYPLTLAVEIARVSVTLGDLARLEPGTALPLDLRKDGAVVLRAGERAIARGQLVEIDGAVGVRVVELSGRP